MSESSSTQAEAERGGTWVRLSFGLLLTPCVVAAAAHTLPALHVELWQTDAIAFGGAALLPILSLALAASVEVSLAVALAIALPAAAALLVVAWFRPSPEASVLVVDAALVCLSWALGSSLGRRVQHPAHLLPACVVAASADLASLLSPEGPSHAIAESDRALSVLAVWFPIPGSYAVAPALGVGDLLFMALVFGIVRAHRLPYARSVVLCAVGTGLAGLAAARLGVAVPALVPIAAAIVLGLPAVRRLRRSDRTAALLSMLIAGAVAFTALARSLFGPH
jgi:hypothetical protein